jgi:hypothetical protein
MRETILKCVQQQQRNTYRGDYTLFERLRKQADDEAKF